MLLECQVRLMFGFLEGRVRLRKKAGGQKLPKGTVCPRNCRSEFRQNQLELSKLERPGWKAERKPQPADMYRKHAISRLLKIGLLVNFAQMCTKRHFTIPSLTPLSSSSRIFSQHPPISVLPPLSLNSTAQ